MVEPVRMVLGNIRESPTNQKIEQGILIRTPVPCLGAGWPPLCPGVCPLDSTPRPRGVLPQALRALFLGAQPRCPPVPLGTGNQKPPTPLLYYLSEGRRSLPSHED